MNSTLNPIKRNISILLDFLQIYKIIIRFSNKNYIRIINYHSTSKDKVDDFESQLVYYKKHFNNVEYAQFEEFLQKKFFFTEKPGIMICFDDGCLDNYEVAAPLLEKYGFTGYFFIPSAYMGKGIATSDYDLNRKFMNWKNIKDLKRRNHVIGSHTKNHHRINVNDTTEMICDEIVSSKDDIESNLEQRTDIFCWVGGEEYTYTKQAMDMIKQYYKYSFITMASKVRSFSDPYFLPRTNVESYWPLHIIKFQIWGPMDIISKSKRKRVYSSIMK